MLELKYYILCITPEPSQTSSRCVWVRFIFYLAASRRQLKDEKYNAAYLRAASVSRRGRRAFLRNRGYTFAFAVHTAFTRRVPGHHSSCYTPANDWGKERPSRPRRRIREGEPRLRCATTSTASHPVSSSFSVGAISPRLAAVRTTYCNYCSHPARSV